MARLYTLIPDRNFIISPLPCHPRIALGVGTGHGFKFASAIGKALGEIAPFHVDRPTLSPDAEFQNFYVE